MFLLNKTQSPRNLFSVLTRDVWADTESPSSGTNYIVVFHFVCAECWANMQGHMVLWGGGQLATSVELVLDPGGVVTRVLIITAAPDAPNLWFKCSTVGGLSLTDNCILYWCQLLWMGIIVNTINTILNKPQLALLGQASGKTLQLFLMGSCHKSLAIGWFKGGC